MITRLWNYKHLFLVIIYILVASLIGLTGCEPTIQTYTLITRVDPAGAGSISPSGGQYEPGMQVTLIATPASDYTFDYWEGSASGTSPTITIIVDSDKSVIAHFKPTTPETTKILFSDDFSDESSGWDTYADEEGSAFYQDGWLHIKDNPYGVYAENSYGYQYFTDFVLEVETKLVDGTEDNWQRIICRSDEVNNYYSFDISADGYYEILKFVNGNRVVLRQPTVSIDIHQGRGVINFVRVECIGSTLRLSVNDHLLAEVTDSTFTGGDIALGADSLGGAQFTEVAFDNIVVTEP